MDCSSRSLSKIERFLESRLRRLRQTANISKTQAGTNFENNCYGLLVN